MSNLNKIYCDDSFAGNGKTTRAIERMVSNSTRWIYCCERVETFTEVIEQIEGRVKVAGTSPQIIPICRGNSASVKRRVEGLIDEAIHQHTIALITHAALLMSDFSHFEGWSLIIDEVPSLLTINHIRTDTSVKIFRDLYDLVPFSDHEGWSEIRPSREGNSKSNADVQADDISSNLASFHRAALSAGRGHGKMIARLSDWDQASTKKKWFYSTWFSFLNLQAFDFVLCLGNGFMNSVDVQVVRSNDDLIAAEMGQKIEWVQIEKPANQLVKPRKVTLRYFQEKHATASQSLKPAGQRNLIKVAKYLNVVLPPDAIWSANNGSAGKESETNFGDGDAFSVKNIMSRYLKRDYISPRQAGSNRYRAHHAMAFIYTANSSPDCTALLKLNGLKPNAWRSTKEHETILQGLTRTSIRDADSDHPVDFYVMDEFDAKYCAAYFDNLGHDVRIKFVNLGLEAVIDGRKDNGPKTLYLTAEERKARERELGRVRTAKYRGK